MPDLFTSSANSYILVFVLGVLGITTEFRYQTITPTVLQTPSRWAIVTAKMITYALVGIIYAFAAVVIQLLVAGPWLSAKGISVDYGSSDVLGSLVAVFGVVALYGIVGLGVGALIRNQIVAVVVGIVFLLILQNILVAIPGVKHVFPFMPGGATAAILTTTGSRRHQRRLAAADRRRCARPAALGLRARGRRRRAVDEPRHHLTPATSPDPAASPDPRDTPCHLVGGALRARERPT